MARFVVKRLLWMIPVLLGVTILIFSLMYLVPGDPARIICGEFASDAELAVTRDRLGLNDPFFVQLGRYMYNVFAHFNFGASYRTGISVTTELATRLPRTLVVGISALFLSVAIGVPLGIIAAVRRNGLGDRISMILAMIGVSMPSFWLALLLVLFFSLRLSLLPATGISSFSCYIMPAVSMCVGGLCSMARQSRSSMLEVIRADYVLTGRAKGLSEREVILGHALPNALLPIITLAGSQFAHVFGGAVAIETVFAIPGVGSYLVNAINNRDYPVIEGSVIMLAFVFSAVMLIVDLVYGFIDPRIKAQFIGKSKKR